MFHFRRHILRLVLFASLQAAALAQARAPQGRLEELNSRITAGLAPRDEAEASLRERYQLLVSLMREDPAAARRLLLPDGIAERLRKDHPLQAEMVEERGRWDGELVVAIDDDFENETSRVVRWLKVGDTTIPVHDAVGLPESSCRSQVSIDGYRLGGELLAISATDNGSEAAGSCSTTGVQQTLVILANLPTHALPAVLTNSFTNTAYFGSGFSINGFYQDASYGLASLSGTVVTVTLGSDYDCSNINAIVNAAINAADSLVDMRTFTRVAVISPRITSCAIGLGLIGCTSLSSPSKGSFVASWTFLGADYLTDTQAVISVGGHELGHNLGLGHSNTRDFGAVALGPVGGSATDSEYWDVFSIMGLSYRIGNTIIIGHMPPRQKAMLGWLTQGTDYLSIESGGSYVLKPYENQTSGLKALRVRRGTGGSEWLWLEYRQSVGLFDSTLSTYSSQAYSGPMIRQERTSDPSSQTYLLDMNPSATPNDFKNAPLAAGHSWSDPYTDLGISAATGTGGVAVNITYSSQTCSYTLQPTSIAVPASGGDFYFDVTTGASCAYQATTSLQYVTFGTGSSGTGSGRVNFSVAANAGTGQRSGSISAGGQSVTITQAGTASAVMSLSRTSLNFGRSGSWVTSPQNVNVTFTGGSGVAWSASSNRSNITVTPVSGSGNGTLQISATAGSSGVITVTAPGASNSPIQINVTVASVTAAPPFGSFDTPANNTNGIAGSIAVTGWALDNIEVSKVDIWREPNQGEPAQSNGLVYIGDAVLVAGARPDVETAYPTTPLNYRAGWGYLMLTNLLPSNNGTAGTGNGTYKLHAIAHNKSGSTLDLGTHTITCDNTHAAKPFGAIDTPGQGETISGSTYVNFGWALTPQPGVIPTNGSTIQVYIDGAAVGTVTYNNARSDIDTLFPGYANTGGAVGYRTIDTTTLTNGMHSIAWSVTDNLGRTDGIGSRYFFVLNAAGDIAAQAENAAEPSAPVRRAPRQGVTYHTGYSPAAPERVLRSGVSGRPLPLRVRQLERIEINLPDAPAGAAWTGALRVGDELRPLPVGSTLESDRFLWQLGPAFLGAYRLEFRPARTGSGARPVAVQVVVQP